MHKMFLEIVLLIIVIALLVYIFFIFAKPVFSPSIQQSSLNSVCVKNRCFFVELAKTDSERERGLMFRDQLPKDNGMLFIFDKEGVYPFWMKNTLISLDIIWADNQGRVVYVSQSTQPCKSLLCPQIIPTSKARYVLEVNGGMSEELGLKLGDELGINID